MFLTPPLLPSEIHANALANEDFRRVRWTGSTQIVNMAIGYGADAGNTFIGWEKHEAGTSQYFVIEEGEADVLLGETDREEDARREHVTVGAKWMVEPGWWHDVRGKFKATSIYFAPHHAPGTVDKTRRAAEYREHNCTTGMTLLDGQVLLYVGDCVQADLLIDNDAKYLEGRKQNPMWIQEGAPNAEDTRAHDGRNFNKIVRAIRAAVRGVDLKRRKGDPVRIATRCNLSKARSVFSALVVAITLEEPTTRLDQLTLLARMHHSGINIAECLPGGKQQSIQLWVSRLGWDFVDTKNFLLFCERPRIRALSPLFNTRAEWTAVALDLERLPSLTKTTQQRIGAMPNELKSAPPLTSDDETSDVGNFTDDDEDDDSFVPASPPASQPDDAAWSRVATALSLRDGAFARAFFTTPAVGPEMDAVRREIDDRELAMEHCVRANDKMPRTAHPAVVRACKAAVVLTQRLGHVHVPTREFYRGRRHVIDPVFLAPALVERLRFVEPGASRAFTTPAWDLLAEFLGFRSGFVAFDFFSDTPTADTRVFARKLADNTDQVFAVFVVLRERLDAAQQHASSQYETTTMMLVQAMIAAVGIDVRPDGTRVLQRPLMHWSPLLDTRAPFRDEDLDPLK